MPYYPFQKDFKIPAAWLIEQSGLKGHQAGGLQISNLHALVITNPSHGSHQDLEGLIIMIKKQVKANFNIDLELEVELV